MTTIVTIKTTEGEKVSEQHITLSDAALKRARRSFNPSGNLRVDRLKSLAAAFYTELAAIKQDACHAVLVEHSTNAGASERCETVGRLAATAATEIEAGAMFAVSAATA